MYNYRIFWWFVLLGRWETAVGKRTCGIVEINSTAYADFLTGQTLALQSGYWIDHPLSRQAWWRWRWKMFMLKFGSTLLYVCHIVCIEIESYGPIITSISGSAGRLGICTCVYDCSGVWNEGMICVTISLGGLSPKH